jgi:spore maturation protein CgeB
MRFVIFTHSLVSDWDNSDAHFLRGTASEIVRRGHSVRIFEPEDSWSRENLISEHGDGAIAAFQAAYPLIRSETYHERTLDFDDVLNNADVAIVHDWNSYSLVERIGEHHRGNRGYKLYFHDTHHRSVTEPHAMAAYNLQNFTGVLAFGKVIRDIYTSQGWARNAWAWQEAADTRVFRPIARKDAHPEGDLVWIGNWGDEERDAELQEFLIEPVKKMKLAARVYGVRYPDRVLSAFDDAGIEYGGRLPNYLVPQVFSRYRMTIHVPRRPYAQSLPGIPTIRVFEAMACGIPLISAPWADQEKLFRPGKDFLYADSGAEMMAHIETILKDPVAGSTMAGNALRTIRARHTCTHRVDELMEIIGSQEQLSAAGENY